jgi:hypothetical protein
VGGGQIEAFLENRFFEVFRNNVGELLGLNIPASASVNTRWNFGFK